MGDDFNRKLNDQARKTGQTREEILREAFAVASGEPEPTGLRKWVEAVARPFRKVSGMDLENRRIFEENMARKATEEWAAAHAGSATSPTAAEHCEDRTAAGNKDRSRHR